MTPEPARGTVSATAGGGAGLPPRPASERYFGSPKSLSNDTRDRTFAS
jgi:hypothetical protein